MKLKDFKFLDIKGRVRTLPTLTDALQIVTTEAEFDMWKDEFSSYSNSEVIFVDRGACWGGIAVEIPDMEVKSNQYVKNKAGALS